MSQRRATRPRVILVHGFNVRDGGRGSIDRLKPHIERLGYEVVEYDYGYRFLLGVLFCSGADAGALAAICHPDDILIGHSNGGHLIARAIELGMPVKHAIMIHPALRSDWEPPPMHPVEQIHVYYSGKDIATWIARRLPFRRWWGAMGTVGPTGTDHRLIGHPDGQTHSGGFTVNPERYIETLPVEEIA